MAKMPSIGTSLRTSEFPKEDPELLEILSEFMGDVSDAIGGGGSTLTHGNLSLSDNIQCEVVQCTLTHDVTSIVKLRKLSYAKGVMLLGSSTEIIADLYATPGTIAGTSNVTAYFQRGAGTSVVAFVLFQEGLTGGVSKAFGDWIAPTFTNSWVNFGGGVIPAGYMRDSQGRINLRGLIKSGTIGTAAFVLPAGYRPSAIRQFPSVDGLNAAGIVQVDAAGNVVPTIGNNAAYRLDGVSFDTQ